MSEPIIGVLLLEFDSIYDAEAIRALRAAARELQVHLLCFPGNRLGTDSSYLREFNILYPLAAQVRLDGLICFTDTMRGRFSEEDLAAFFAQFGAIPIVSVGGATPGIPVVKPDNVSGMSELVAHLLRGHGYRRLAYVGGPDDNLDARERLAAFTAAHEAAGVPMSNARVLAGRFLRPDGRAAAQALMGEVELPDALVAANDAMAFEALKAFQEEGVCVPEHIALTGFDDLTSSIAHSPPLTSVRQDIGAQARCAVELVLRRLRGEAVPAETTFPSRVVLRRSCGCFDARGAPTPASSWEQPALAVPALQALEAALDEELGGAAAGTRDAPQAGPLRHALHAIGERYRDGGFELNDVRRMLVHLYAGQRGGPRAADAARVLFEAQSWLLDDERMHVGADYLDRIYPSWLMAVMLRRSLSGGAEFSLGNLLASLRGGLLSMGVRDAYVVLYEAVAQLDASQGEARGALLPERAQLVLGIRDGQPLVAADHERFPVRELLPLPLFRAGEGAMLTVLPLFRQDEHHGLLILDATQPYPVSVEQLREVVSNVVTSAIVMGELERTRELLSHDLQRAQSTNLQLSALSEQDELTGLLNRRGFQNRAGELCTRGARPLLLVVADMDGLKAINDAHGHPAGDAAIVAMAGVLRRSFREGDLIARMGGDEFAVLSEHLSQVAIDDLRARIERQIALANEAAPGPWRLALSVGFAPVQVTDSTHLEQIFATADARLYEDKRRRKAERGT